MDLRCVRLHRFLHVQHERQHVVLDLQSAHALHRRDLVFRDDDGDLVPIVAHVPVQQMPVGNVLMAGVHRPRVTGRREGDVRHVEAGQHLDHALDGLSRRGVDRLDVAMGNFRVLDPRIERARRHPVFVIFGSAGRFVKRVDTNLAFAYDAHTLTSNFLSHRCARAAFFRPLPLVF